MTELLSQRAIDLIDRGVLLENIRNYQEKCEELEETLAFYRTRPPLTSTMIFWAFRYCLGRSTFAVMDCVDYLLLYWDRIEPRVRKNIVEEIFKACEKGDCGMEQDKSQWHRVLARGRGKEESE